MNKRQYVTEVYNILGILGAASEWEIFKRSKLTEGQVRRALTVLAHAKCAQWDPKRLRWVDTGRVLVLK